MKGGSLIETVVASAIVMTVFMVAMTMMSGLSGKTVDGRMYNEMCRCRDSVIVEMSQRRTLPESRVYRREWGIMSVESVDTGMSDSGIMTVSVSVVMKCGYMSNIYYLLENDRYGI